jgi:hypothetical protein
MIISIVSEVNPPDVIQFGWNGIRRFQNTSYTTQHIIEIQGIPDNQKRNAQKQANQI